MIRTCRSEQGYTLLEVLIALLVFSIGLLGLAAMLVSAVKGNHQAYHRSQVVNVADAVSEGLRGNIRAVNAGSYDTGGLISSYASGGECQTACSPDEMAARDLSTWARMVNDRLPNGQIGVDCSRTLASPLSDEAGFNGICVIRVAWNETGDVGQAQESTQQVFSWMVQP